VETHTSATTATTTTTTTTTTNTILLALYGSNTYSLKNKDKIFPSRTLKAYKRHGITAPSILNSVTKRS
jgi:hypothetical protein